MSHRRRRPRPAGAGRRPGERFCECGESRTGSRAWRLHRRLHPDHRAVPYHELLALLRARKQGATA